MKTVVIVQTQFEGIHSWPDCPIKSVEFLRYPHRHIFHVKTEILVSHPDRQVEFLYAKKAITEYLHRRWPNGNLKHSSCEMVATDLLTSDLFDFQAVEVFEDGENGVRVEKT